MHASKRLLRLTLIGLAASGGVYCAHGATVNLTASDATGSSSFNAAGNWSNALAPAAGNDYFVASAFTLRTPQNVNTSFSFAGDSLTLDTGTLAFKGNNTPTITIGNLILKNGGRVSNFSTSGTSSTFTLAGNVNVGAGGGQFFLTLSDGGIKVTAAIGGTGPVAINTSNTGQSPKTVEFAHAGNTYSGGTTIAQFASLTVSADGALGAGGVTFNGGKLTLQSGATGNYIADTASFILAGGLTTANASVVLSFTGADSIGGLSFDGGGTYLSGGTYDAATLNSLYGANIFSGTGEFSIAAIPEPSAIALLAGAGVLGLAFWRRSRRAARV